MDFGEKIKRKKDPGKRGKGINKIFFYSDNFFFEIFYCSMPHYDKFHIFPLHQNFPPLSLDIFLS